MVKIIILLGIAIMVPLIILAAAVFIKITNDVTRGG